MSSYKISLKVVEQQKSEYISASKNLTSCIETLKTVQTSLGNDDMFQSVRESAKKLCDTLETKAASLDLMCKALEQITGKYTATEKNRYQKVIISGHTKKIFMEILLP